LVNIDSKTDKLIQDFYGNTMGKYWDEERKLVEDEYDGIDLELEHIIRKKYFFIETTWSSQDLLGYLNSWSSVQNYIKEKGSNPVAKLESEIKLFWTQNEWKNIKFPLFLKLFRVKK
jgi:hypothetical protein